MKLKFSVVLSSLFLFATLFLPAFAFAATYTLSGHVQNSSGTALENAIIEVKNPNTNGVVATTTTNNEGNYTLDVDEGTYTIELTPPSGSGYTPAIALDQNIGNNTVLNFVLVPSGSVTLSGHIYDASGAPVPNAQVRLTQPHGSPDVANVITDASGSYSLTVASGTYGIVVNGNNLGGGLLHIPAHFIVGTGLNYVVESAYSLTESTVVDITIPAKEVTVHVQDSSGDPVSGVALTTNSPITYGGYTLASSITNGQVQGGYVTPVVTNEQGNGKMWLFAMNYTITATPPSGGNYQATSSTVAVTNDPDQNYTITLQEPVTLSGHIYDASGTPVPNARVTLTRPHGSPDVADVTTDASGSYSLTVAPDTYGIEVLGNNLGGGLLHIPAHFTVGTGINYVVESAYTLTESTVVDITIPAKEVTVHVQDSSGDPVSGVALTTNSPITYGGYTLASSITNAQVQGGYVTPIVTNEQGNGTMWLFAMNYAITATPPSGGNYQATSSTVAVTNDPEQNHTITLQEPVTLSGHIYDASGTPVPNARVTLTRPHGSPDVANVITDASGSYSLTVAPDTYGIEVLGNNLGGGLLHIPAHFTVGTGLNYVVESAYSLTENTVVDITIPAKEVTVHVQDSSGDPVSGVALTTNSPITYGGYTLASSITNGQVQGGYVTPVVTNEQGNGKMWLFAMNYTITATPPSGSNYQTYPLYNVSIQGNQTEVISLQYNHATPVTTATLETEHQDGTYSDPTTVTLSATAADGYTVANIYYKVDGGTQQTYTDPFAVSGTGDHTIEYWSVDNSGVHEAHKTKPFTIYLNQAPFVDPFPGATINTGQTYTASSFFTDTDSSTWTATVDYDDGAGEESLTLNPDKTFSLSHQYATAGTYHVTVVVRDNQQATGTTQATVIVESASQPIGNPTPGDTEDSSNRNIMNGTKFSVGPVGGAVTSMSVYVGDVNAAPNNQYQMAIYTNKIKANGDAIPGTLVAQTTSGTLTANSWNTLPITATFSPNTTYWLTYNTNASTNDANNMYFTSGDPEVGVYVARTYGTWPTNYPNNPTLTNQRFSIYASMNPNGSAPTVLAGNANVESNHDQNNAGRAEAFKFTALTTGTANTIALYLNSDNAASQVRVGVYTDNNNNPGTLLAQTVISSPLDDTWNTVTLPTTNITAGTNYWIAILSPQGSGTVRFRDKATGGTSVGSQQTNLTTLPATWTTGQNWTTTDISAYLY